jgi:colicin import membrane protein
MKQLLALALALGAVLPALALDEAAERERIQGERAAVEARFLEQQKACRAKFAVTGCENKARHERSATLTELKRQEQVLDDLDRRRRAAERQHDLEERNSPEALQKAEERRAKALQDQKERDARAREKAQQRTEDQARRAAQPPRQKAAPGAPSPQGSARVPQSPLPHGPTVEEAAKNRAEYDKRLKDAEEHNAKLRQKEAERKKPPAPDLPPPQ